MSSSPLFPSSISTLKRALKSSALDCKELRVEDIGSIKCVNIGAIAQRMTQPVSETRLQSLRNVETPELRAFVIPSFGTTTDCDRTVASILMMGSRQKYFSYGMRTCCSIPLATLLAKGLTTFADLPQPILRRFIASFNPKAANLNRDFKDQIAYRRSYRSGFSGNLSGWIGASCPWDTDGRLLYNISWSRGPHQVQTDAVFDGVTYPIAPTKDIPASFASAPVPADDNGHIYCTRMIAESLGIVATSRVMTIYAPENDDTISTVEQHQGVEAAQQPCCISSSAIEYLSKSYRIGQLRAHNDKGVRKHYKAVE